MYSFRGNSRKDPDGTEPFHVHRISEQEWDESNFASQSDLKWFRDAKYGMFIHFGLSARINADLSWGTCHARKLPDIGHGPTPDDVWKAWPNEMRLEAFDAGDWVAIAKKAGFKYIVVITKHHEGFHMWDTAYSGFKITNTPFGRDYLKELSDACHEAGIALGFYYSQRDWYHPDYMPVDESKAVMNGYNWTLKPGETSPMGKSHAKYIEYQYNVCRELCTKYGKVSLFWWDADWTGGMFTKEMWDSENLTREMRRLQPGIVMNNRCSLPGDYDTPEARLGMYQDWRPWESCICLEPSFWSYTGAAPKSRDTIIRMLVNNLCCDGNFLLSWGPKWSGEFDTAQTERLIEIGEWLKQNGKAVYGTRGGPWIFNTKVGSVRTGNTIYLHILDLQGEELNLPAIPGNHVLNACLLNGGPVKFIEDDVRLTIHVPDRCRMSPDTIIELAMSADTSKIESIKI